MVISHSRVDYWGAQSSALHVQPEVRTPVILCRSCESGHQDAIPSPRPIRWKIPSAFEENVTTNTSLF